jgi:prepilin-type N-terminal cleavage/methylation domain-containing protein
MAPARGFTLLEVAVALVILALGLAALLPLFTTGLRLAGEASRDRAALRLAQSKLAELQAAAVPGESAGVEGGLSWRLRVEPVTPAPPRLAAFVVRVTVTGPGRPVTLQSAVLGAGP